MAAVKPGAKAPKFSIPTTAGEFRSVDHAGENLVIYFYPRDNTPGCTLEGGDFRDLEPAFRRARASSASRRTPSNRTGGSGTR